MVHLEKFKKEFEVHYYQIDKNTQVTPLSIVRMLEEMAVCHSEYVGVGVNEMKQKNMGWVLCRWDIIIEKYPVWQDLITIETWSSNIEKFSATREFYIRDTDGNICVRASSLWVLVNLGRRRPVRVPSEMIEQYGQNPEKAINPSDEKIVFNEVCLNQEIFKVRKSDIDTNEHVNNASYIEWALEIVPGEICDHYQLIGLEIVYKKEAVLGNTIISAYEITKGNLNEEIILHIIMSEDGNVEFAVAKTKWRVND